MPGGRYGITNGRVGYPYYNYTEGNRAQEFTMMNKEIFDNPEKYQFAASESQSGASFGQTVSHPHRFVLGKGIIIGYIGITKQMLRNLMWRPKS